MLKLIKYFFYFLIMVILLFFLCFLFVFQNLRFSSPTLSSLAQNLPPFSTAVAFNYSKNIDKQLYLFSKNIGLENNPRTRQQEPAEGNIGATGFFIFDIDAYQSKFLFHKLDVVLNEMLDFLNQVSLNENSVQKKLVVDETEDNSYESPFISPLSSLLEEMWNGKTFTIGGATQFYLSYEDSFMLALGPYVKNKSNFFRDMIIKNVPMYLQDFLNKHAIHVDIEPAIPIFDNTIHESQIILSIDNPEEFLESICSLKINPWDICGRFSLNRQIFRKNAQSLLGLVNQNFKLTLNIFWTIRGKDIIYANQKNLILKLIGENNTKSQNNVLTDVAASGDDFLLSSSTSLKYSSLSFYFDMIKAQNEGISFLEGLKKYSQVMSDYFSSPNGEIVFRSIEKQINEITQYSQKTSIAFHTDGEHLLPKLRMYSPSNDLFTQDGEALTPEFKNSIRVFVTQFVSFGNYLLPRGLVPIPGPYFSRNGRWVILKSEIMTKSLAPYLESVDPYIDRQDTPSAL